jgi:hypothetical protein
MTLMLKLRYTDACCCALLIVAALVFSLPGIFHRSIWYDEAITMVSMAHQNTTAWPRGPQPAANYKKNFEGNLSLSQIATALKRSDIHPPLYFWSLSKWRQAFGTSLESVRIHSLAYFIIGIIVLYCLLRESGLKRPLIPALMFSIAYSAAHLSGEARAYSLANTLVIIGAYFAYRSTPDAGGNRFKYVYCSFAMALASGAAFLTNYLAIFPVTALFAWFIWQHSISAQEKRKPFAFIYPLIGMAICLLWVPVLMKHLGARPHQAAGYLGFYNEVIKVVWMNILGLFSFQPNNFQFLFHWKIIQIVYQAMIFATLLVLLLTTVMFSIKKYRQMNGRLFSLLVVLAIAPSAGLFALDFLFDKNLNAVRYLFFGLFPIVVLLYWGICHMKSKAIVIVTLSVAITLQLLGNNWASVHAHHHNGSYWREFAQHVENSAEKNKIVVIMAGFGRGIPSAVTYELNDDQTVMVAHKDDNIDELMQTLKGYRELWFALAFDDPAYRGFQSTLINGLLQTGRWQLATNQKGYVCLQGKEPANTYFSPAH